jgi:hypothetical protein
MAGRYETPACSEKAMSMDDYIEPDWTNPASLRACAERLKANAAKMAIEMDKYRRFKPEPVAGNPFVDLLDENYVEDPAVTAERETFFRTQRAKAEIEAALAEEAKQQQAKARQQFYSSGIGRLLR